MDCQRFPPLGERAHRSANLLMTSAWKDGFKPPTDMKCWRHCSRGSCPSGQRTQCVWSHRDWPWWKVCLTSLVAARGFTRERLATRILPMRPERILATPDNPMEMGPCNTESIAVSRILVAPVIRPRTHCVCGCCETLRRPPHWLLAAVHAAGEW